MRGVHRLARTGGDWRRYEAAVPAGLEDVAADELRERLGLSVTVLLTSGPTRHGNSSRITFTYPGDPRQLMGVQTVLAVYRIASSNVARPRAFLGEEHLQRFTAVMGEVIRLWPPHSFATLRIG